MKPKGTLSPKARYGPCCASAGVAADAMSTRDNARSRRRTRGFIEASRDGILHRRVSREGCAAYANRTHTRPKFADSTTTPIEQQGCWKPKQALLANERLARTYLGLPLREGNPHLMMIQSSAEGN